MLMGVRMYATEQNARNAAAKLIEEELVSEERISIFTPGSGGAEEVVQAAVQEKRLPVSHARLAVQALEKGQFVVSIPLPMEGAWAMEIMDSFGSLDVGPEPVQRRRDPSPFSDIFAIPTLTSGKSTTPLMTKNRVIFRNFLGLPLLKKSVSKESSFGMPLLRKGHSNTALSKNGTPLSSMLGLKTLTGPKR